MGYTHYWTLENGIEQEDWNKFLEGARKVIETAKEAGIALEDNSAGAAIHFNGVGADAHETFNITSEDVGFEFCKTAFKPYDAVVTAILIHAKDCFGSAIKVTSDGNWVDWEGGTLLYEEVFGIEPQQILGV
jgi:hypothetical protein